MPPPRGFAAAALAVAALTAAPIPVRAEKPRAERQVAARDGLPTAAGLGAHVVLTNLETRDARWKAAERLAKHRGAKVVRFKGSDVRSAATALARAGAEFVVLAVDPATVDMNLHQEVLEVCRGLDDDPMPDFHFGYLCARDGADLSALVDRILEREAAAGADAPVAASVVAATPPGDHLKALDLLLHFGHGMPWEVVDGLTAEQVAALELSRGPVVFSGACFNGVLSRSYHPSAYHLVFGKPLEVAPERLLSLAWVHAGATALLAALEGDRGEMATAEWERLRERAGTLGETIGHQYRLAFTSLPSDFEGFPRYVPGARKRMSFYDVMLRGMVSRILLSDPAFRPLRAPLDPPSTALEVRHDPAAKTVVVTSTAQRWSQGAFLNYLPKAPSDRFDHRRYERAELPKEVVGRLGPPRVTALWGEAEIALTQSHVKHEAWGGARFVNVQAESTDGSLSKPGAAVTWTFPILP